MIVSSSNPRFGLPIYRFLSRDDASVRIVNFARECMDDRITPVFMGYPLGRGQEIALLCVTAGYPQQFMAPSRE